jgi:prephenate dehydrogenase
LKSDFIVGIIGSGGRMGAALNKFFINRKVKTVTSDIGSTISNKDLAKESDIVILAVPLTSYEAVLEEIKDSLNNEKMLMDIGSLKFREVKLMKKYFQGEILATHPLFGPEKGFKGKENNIAVCKINSKGKTDFILNMFRKSGLNIIEMTPEEHDRTMAYIHGFYYLMNITYIGILKDNFKSFDKIKNLTTTSFSKYIENLNNNVFNTQDSLIELIVYKNPFIREAVNEFHEKLFKKIDFKELKGFLNYE